MRASLPVSAQLMVAPWLAQRLRNVAEQLPRFENQEFYSTELQTMVHDALREATLRDPAKGPEVNARIATRQCSVDGGAMARAAFAERGRATAAFREPGVLLD